MEWVIVTYKRERDVFVDGRRAGFTNRKLIVIEGTHRFDLGTPADYTPSRRIVTVTDTAESQPKTVEFS